MLRIPGGQLRINARRRFRICDGKCTWEVIAAQSHEVAGFGDLCSVLAGNLHEYAGSEVIPGLLLCHRIEDQLP